MNFGLPYFRSILFVNLILFLSLKVFADLPFMPVGYQLSSDKKIYKPGELITFKLKISNNDKERTYPIVLPGTQNKGRKLIRIQAFSVNQKTQFYTTAAKENEEFKMNCSRPGGVSARNLKPGESLEIMFFLNDKKNYLSQTASHHSLEPELKEGKYEFLIFYDPSGTELKNIYHYIGTTNDSTSSEKLNFWYGGNVSNYITIEISSSAPKNATGQIKNKCQENCSFCSQIENQDWKKVEQNIQNNITKDPEFYAAVNQGEWMKDHQQVLWLSPPPEAVLSSLPTYFSREVIFSSKGELFYFYTFYQWGMVYTQRLRVKGFVHHFWKRFKVITTEDLNYIGLKGFEEVHCS